MNQDQLVVWQAVRALNRTWVEGRVHELGAWFHPQVVAVTPADSGRLVGRGPCLGAWKRFVDTARVLAWEERDPLVQLWGDVAVVNYGYRAVCDFEEGPRELVGRDTMVLLRTAEGWKLVADHFSGEPGRDG